MLTFKYTAKNSETGETVVSEVQAQSEQAAAKLLVKQHLMPVSLELKDAKKGLFGMSGGGRHKVRAKDRILYTRQLATLINAGLPLTQSLRTVGEQTPNKTLQAANAQVVADVEGGSTLAAAFAKHPKIFNNIYIQLISAGEASGTLDESLIRIATQQEKDAAVLSKIRGALIYPVIVIVVIIGVLIFMLTTVVPQIETLYADLNRDLPLLTRLLVGTSRIFTDFWFVVIPVVAIAFYLVRVWAKTEGGTSVFDRLRLRIPLFGPMFMKLYMARFARTAHTLLAAGVPLLETLRITAEAINNVHVEASINHAATRVKGGKALSDSLTGDSNFMPLVPQMIKIGEQSGSLDAMLEKVATYYEDELDAQIKTISTIIEPILMVILAVMAAIVIAAVLLPVYGLVGQSVSF